MYQRPTSTTYNALELRELVGPVSTQYACVSCDSTVLAPDEILQGKVEALGISFNFAGCQNFDTVRVEGPPSQSPFLFFELDRSSGTESGTQWEGTGPDFPFAWDPSSYEIVVTLIESDGTESSPCPGMLTIQ